MKKHRQLLALLICLVMSVSLLTGYSETKAATEEPAQSGEQDATQETAETREITDMAGRKVTVPVAENIESVFSAGPVAAIFLYMVALLDRLMIHWFLIAMRYQKALEFRLLQ